MLMLKFARSLYPLFWLHFDNIFADSVLACVMQPVCDCEVLGSVDSVAIEDERDKQLLCVSSLFEVARDDDSRLELLRLCYCTELSSLFI
jgi:hypothetical protein